MALPHLPAVRRPELKADAPTASFGIISQSIGALWKEMGAAERQLYTDRAAGMEDMVRNEGGGINVAATIAAHEQAAGGPLVPASAVAGTLPAGTAAGGPSQAGGAVAGGAMLTAGAGPGHGAAMSGPPSGGGVKRPGGGSPKAGSPKMQKL